jgi:hypothetical protein
MKRFSLRYLLLTSGFEQVWFPLSFWVLFVIIAFLRGQMYILDTARAYLGAVIPLGGGILAAYAVLEDPALELRFATPVSSLQTLLERLVPTFLVQTCFALTYQLFALVFFKADFSAIYGTWVSLQLAWLIPTLSLIALGCFSAMLATHATTGALIAGMVWLVQLVARAWFAGDKIGQYLLVFMSSFMLDHPALRVNQMALLATSILLLLASWALLQRQERYI